MEVRYKSGEEDGKQKEPARERTRTSGGIFSDTARAAQVGKRNREDSHFTAHSARHTDKEAVTDKGIKTPK